MIARQIETARRLRRDGTDAERRIWHCVRAGRIGGAKFRRQQPMGRYVVDFVCHEAKLIIEVDGGQHAEQGAADAARTRWLESQGYRVIRFWNNEVLANTEGVLAEIANCLAPSPRPSPIKGEGEHHRVAKMETHKGAREPDCVASQGTPLSPCGRGAGGEGR